MKVSMVNLTNFYGTPSKKAKDEKTITTSQEDFNSKCIDEAYRSGKNTGFVLGAAAAMLMTAGACNLYEKCTDNKVLEDMQKTICDGDVEQIKIDEYNNTPCIVLESDNGDADIYDIKSGKIFVKIGDEIVEKD